MMIIDALSSKLMTKKHFGKPINFIVGKTIHMNFLREYQFDLFINQIVGDLKKKNKRFASLDENFLLEKDKSVKEVITLFLSLSNKNINIDDALKKFSFEDVQNQTIETLTYEDKQSLNLLVIYLLGYEYIFVKNSKSKFSNRFVKIIEILKEDVGFLFIDLCNKPDDIVFDENYQIDENGIISSISTKINDKKDNLGKRQINIHNIKYHINYLYGLILLLFSMIFSCLGFIQPLSYVDYMNKFKLEGDESAEISIVYPMSDYPLWTIDEPSCYANDSCGVISYFPKNEVINENKLVSDILTFDNSAQFIHTIDIALNTEIKRKLYYRFDEVDHLNMVCGSLPQNQIYEEFNLLAKSNLVISTSLADRLLTEECPTYESLINRAIYFKKGIVKTVSLNGISFYNHDIQFSKTQVIGGIYSDDNQFDAYSLLTYKEHGYSDFRIEEKEDGWYKDEKNCNHFGFDGISFENNEDKFIKVFALTERLNKLGYEVRYQFYAKDYEKNNAINEYSENYKELKNNYNNIVVSLFGAFSLISIITCFFVKDNNNKLLYKVSKRKYAICHITLTVTCICIGIILGGTVSLVLVHTLLSDRIIKLSVLSTYFAPIIICSLLSMSIFLKMFRSNASEKLGYPQKYK